MALRFIFHYVLHRLEGPYTVIGVSVSNDVPFWIIVFWLDNFGYIYIDSKVD